jgi:hypothetical protein
VRQKEREREIGERGERGGLYIDAWNIVALVVGSVGVEDRLKQQFKSDFTADFQFPFAS